jgi:hypothetical protein
MKKASFNMKNFKIKSGLLAFVFGLAIVFSQSAFKYANNQSFDKRTFYYHGPSSSTQAQVEDENNWSTVLPDEECRNQQEAACEIQIDESYVDNPSSPAPTLNSSANLSSALNTTTSSSYITSSSDPTMGIKNTRK